MIVEGVFGKILYQYKYKKYKEISLFMRRRHIDFRGNAIDIDSLFFPLAQLKFDLNHGILNEVRKFSRLTINGNFGCCGIQHIFGLCRHLRYQNNLAGIRHGQEPECFRLEGEKSSRQRQA